MRVLITGASGFIGSHIAHALTGRGHTVRGLVRTTSDVRNLDGAGIERVIGDILDPASLDAAMAGCDLVFHTASPYTYWGIPEKDLFETTVAGAQHALQAAHRQGVKRFVLTSSSVVAGSTHEARALGEAETMPLDDEPAYVRAKAAQEQAVLDLGRALGIETVAIRPTVTVGGPDHGPTESNRMVVRYLSDPMKATWIGGANVVGVEDVAAGHLLIAERGEPGGSYVLGGENLAWPAIHRLISELTGLPGPWITAWETSAVVAAAAYEFASRLTGKPPPSSREQARMVGRYYWYDDTPARTLGYRPASTRQALARALSWLVASDHIPNDLRARLRLAPEVYAVR
ncbi:MAG: NAD-dependent epimerase/dehydratase family protein [Rhodothermales bacterium]